MTLKIILDQLKALGDPENVAGMARYGITAKKAYGVSAPDIRSLAKKIGTRHGLAVGLWKTEIYDARILAALVDVPALVTEEQMEAWVKDFDNWAVCDGVCIHLFRKTEFAWEKAEEWSDRGEEFVKRAGFTLFATLAVHDKRAADKKFENVLPVIKKEAADERNGVKKAVNWALRQIGKRNLRLNRAAIKAAAEIKEVNSPSARWIAGDALRELKSRAVKNRLLSKKASNG